MAFGTNKSITRSILLKIESLKHVHTYSIFMFTKYYCYNQALRLETNKGYNIASQKNATYDINFSVRTF